MFVSSQKVPAYKRFQHLTAPEPADDSMPMPSKFNDLFEIFRSIDTVVNLLNNRNEICSFSKVKPAVQRICKKLVDFSLK